MAAASVTTSSTALAALTTHDRCDRCGAQAYVKVKHAGSDYDLMFCGHHYGRFEVGLDSDDFSVVADDRHTLTVR